MHSKAHFMRTAFLISFALLLNACGKKELSNVESGTANQILHVSIPDEPRELDPQLSTGSPEHSVHLALFEGLTKRHPKTLAVTPGIAESWTISEDGLTYVFTLRENAKWSNGDPIRAEDFVWSWQRSLMQNFASEWAYMKYYIKNAKKYYEGTITDFAEVGVKAITPTQLEVTLNYPTEFFTQLTGHYSYSPVHKATILKHGAMDQAISKWTLPENQVGSGPFKLTKWVLNNEIAVVKNGHYWDANNVKLNGIHFYPITDQQAEVRAFKTGKIHLTYSPQMAIEKIAYYQKNEPEVLRIAPTYSTYDYELNTTKPPFDNKLVRRAFAMAIDRDTIVERVSKGGERPAYNFIPPDPQGYQPKQLFRFDVEKAKALLAEAGYTDLTNFPETELLYNTQDNHRKIATALQQMWLANLGVKVTLRNQEWKVYLNSKQDLDHSLARAGWIADYLDPSNFLETLASYSGNNDTGWKHQGFDDLIQELQKTASKEERYALFDKANELLADEMPVIPLYNYSDVNLVSKDVKGWYENAMHEHPYNRVYLEASSAN